MPELAEQTSLATTGQSTTADALQVPELAAISQQQLQLVLKKFNGNRAAAAQHLGISRSTLWRRMKAQN
jgi:propionate catabolism operon transcriptional regulator